MSLRPRARLTTSRLLLRAWELSDAGIAQATFAHNDAHLRRFIPFTQDEPRTLEQTRVWLGELRDHFQRGVHWRYAVFDRDELELLGEAMLLDRHGDGRREVGYWIARAHCGRGYATEAAGAMVDVAWNDLRLDRLELRCSEDNGPSIAVARKLGYTLDERLPSLTDGAATLLWSLRRAPWTRG